MTFELIARTIPVEGAFEETAPVPFGRSACCLLPDGTYLVAVYGDGLTGNDVINVWKIGAAGGVLDSLVIDTGGNSDGRPYLIALDGFLVQLLYLTGAATSRSYLLDASADAPVVLDDWADNLRVNAYGADNPIGHLYLRDIGVVAVCSSTGTALYRRGRPLVIRTGGTAVGQMFGPYPHPSDPTKFAAWYDAPSGSGLYFQAWEFTVEADDDLTLALMAMEITADSYWIHGISSPYAANPHVLNAVASDQLQIMATDAPTVALWSDPDFIADPAVGFSFVNSDSFVQHLGDSHDRWVFMHEMGIETGEVYPGATPSFKIRAGIVDSSAATPTVEMLRLEYGATSPDGPLQSSYYVSLMTGSHSIDHRNGEIVIATCIVEQEGLDDYYAVVSWKLTGGTLARLSGLDGAWRLGVNNGGNRLNLQTTSGMLPEASEVTGIDTPARPAYVKTSEGWQLLGRFADTSEPDLPEPAGPTFLDVVFTPDEINTDLAAAQTLAGASFTASAQTWGPFVAQASPPSAADLADASDATITTLQQSAAGGADVEVFTARMVPDAVIPPGAIPYRAAWTVRARAGASATSGTFLDGMITVANSQATIRGRNLYTAFDLSPTLSTNCYGAGTIFSSPAGLPPRFEQAYVPAQTLENALVLSSETAAAWWDDYFSTATNYVTVQSAATNIAHGALEVAEMALTIRYILT